MLQAKQYYLDQFKNGPIIHQFIAKRMNNKFSKISVAQIRDELIEEGVIQFFRKDPGKNGKYDYWYELTGKQPVAKKQQIGSVVVDAFWPEGWKKSTNNAFNWRAKGQTTFTKREIVQTQQKYTPHPQVIVYSKA